MSDHHDDADEEFPFILLCTVIPYTIKVDSVLVATSEKTEYTD
jgi:hypothetical protein